MARKIQLSRLLDKWVILIFLIMIIFGWFNVYGASYGFHQTNFWGFEYRSGKQLIWIACAFVIGGIILLLDSKYYEQLAYIFYVAVLFLLAITIFVAPNIKGSHSWLVFGPVSFQPAELAKLATALALAKYISHPGFSLSKREDAMWVFSIILVPFILIVLQSETGSALVFLAFFLMLYREGLPGIFLLIVACLILLFLIVLPLSEVPIYSNVGSLGFLLALSIIYVIEIGAIIAYERDWKLVRYFALASLVLFGIGLLLQNWYNIVFDKISLVLVIASSLYLLFLFLFKRKRSYLWIGLFAIGATIVSFSGDYFFDHVLEQHQRTRIAVVLGMENDPRGVGYNVNQSKIAIGSGGFWGKGFLQGTQTKLKYVPEQDTDFIFCTVGEEYGFVGSAVVLVLYVLLLFRLIKIAESYRDTFTRVYTYSIVSIMFFHVVINVGMVLGLTPVIGIPLPFFSYGGSSLWSFTVMLFIILRLDVSQKLRFR
ncbi:rod shape determining protein RodA [Microbacter margulisiae]|uniref:Cell wall polymerase n=2 Tax=Microbacter margulisiae TaxID=1350067 RepID=A0A7W5DN24_9PORP|nr:rod shape-determining protein RodA [Microbacter margulisiae]MBB3185876.1 rod shape determining protein RodA [Microbacter margulisiae]